MTPTTLTIDFHGISLVVTGRYREAEPEVNCPAGFEIAAVQAKAVLASEVRLVELASETVSLSVLDYIESEALALVEAGFEAAAEEAADARREARRDAERE